jgi:hypothetical protein
MLIDSGSLITSYSSLPAGRHLLQDLLDALHLGIDRSEGRHKRSMDLCRRHGDLLKGKISRGAGVVSDAAGEPQVKGCPHRGVHAHRAHHPADHERLHSVVPETLQQAGTPKTVGELLGNDRFSSQGGYSGINLGSLGIGEEEGGAGPGGEVPDMIDRTALFPEGSQIFP